MRDNISQEFTTKSLLHFALPSIIMMIFMALYTIVDGMFVAQFVGTDALSAMNIAFPILSLLMAVSIMFATGGSALTGKRIGEGKSGAANSAFSLITAVNLVASLVFIVVMFLAPDPVLRALGANDLLLNPAKTYIQMMMLFAPASVLQMLYTSFFVTAGKPSLGLILTIAAGLLNVLLDYVFIVPMQMGIVGAALGTGIGYLVPAIIGTIFFFKNKTGLHFVKPVWEGRAILESASNGASEMVANLAMAVTTLFFNIITMRLAGPDGVAAITAVLYCQYFFSGLFSGYSIGVAPIVSYQYGAGRGKAIGSIEKISWIFIIAGSVVIFFMAYFGSGIVASIFSPAGSNARVLMTEGLKVFSPSFLFMGVNVFGSAFFTALSDGKTSAIISFARTFGLMIPSMFILSNAYGLLGLWASIPAAEALTAILVFYYASRLAKTGYFAREEKKRANLK